METKKQWIIPEVAEIEINFDTSGADDSSGLSDSIG